MGVEASTGKEGIGVAGRMVRVFYAPAQTFEAVQQRHTWLDWLAPALLTALVATAAVQVSMPLILKAQQEELARVSKGSDLSPAQQAQQRQVMDKMAGFARVAMLASAPMMTFGIVFVAAGILLVVGRFALGGEVTYGQMLAVSGYSSLIGVVQTAWMTWLRQAKGEMLMTLVPGLLLSQERLATYSGRLVNAIDVFVLWQVAVAAVGLAVLCRAAYPKALACLLLVWALVIAGAAFVGSFRPGA